MNTATQEQRSFNLIPAPGRIIVQEDAFRYEGRIVIPEKAQRRPTVGKIIAVAPDITEWAVGEKIVYGLYSGTVINFKNQPAFRILGRDEILATVTGDPELEGVGT
jgi:co-chaperonin GroES (HSP10)